MASAVVVVSGLKLSFLFLRLGLHCSSEALFQPAQGVEIGCHPLLLRAPSHLGHHCCVLVHRSVPQWRYNAGWLCVRISRQRVLHTFSSPGNPRTNTSCIAYLPALIMLWSIHVKDACLLKFETSVYLLLSTCFKCQRILRKVVHQAICGMFSPILLLWLDIPYM